MSLMANPMDALQSYQRRFDTAPIDSSQLDASYLKLSGKVNGGKKYDFVKIVDGQVHALAIFGEEESFNGVARYSVGYAVSESQRGRGLAVEAVNKGIEELKKEFDRMRMNSFYVEALIDVTNTHSIAVAKRLFSGPGFAKTDSETGTPSLLFYRLVAIQ